jgi:integrase
MTRPRTPIGTYGAISVVEISPGKWRARTRYRFDDGRLRQVERFADGRTGSKAKSALQSAIVDIESGSTTGLTGSTRLSALAEEFLIRKASDGVAQRTIDTYRWAVETVIAPESGRSGIGELTIREATTERLDRFLSTVSASRGNGAAKTCKSVLSGMLGLAVRSGAAKTNPVRDVGRISRANNGATAITTAEMPALLSRVRTDAELKTLDLSVLVEFLAGTGARISEALAMQWDRVDLEGSAITITKNVVRAKGRGLLLQDHTKTEAGMRTIAIPSGLTELLRRRQAEQEPNDGNLVFPSVMLKVRDPNNTLRDWRLNRDRIGAPGSSFHSFRKYVATTLDAAGLSARDIAEYLGHSRPSLTQDTYMSRKVGGSKAAEALDEAIR